jgi:ATP-binding cassette subfamily C protein/ATP-binding cassette subfamily C protein CydC
LQCAQLNTVISQLPQGIDTPLGENACFLSGGERNRLASALILASSAPILLFDEPTAGLDKSTANQLLTAIIDKSNLTSQTVLLITHDLPQLHRFEQIIRLGP